MQMYQQHFGFSGFPFSIAPDPGVLYLSQVHSQALMSLQYGVQREGGFLLLTGEVGTGKTTLTKLFLQQLPDIFKVAYILNPRLNEVDLLLSIAEELHIEPPNGQHNIRDLIKQLNQALLTEHAQGRQVLVVIEEAQNLSYELLEMLRLLTNLETDTNKLLSILLVGQPELLTIINSQQMRQLDQRIIARYHIQPLSFSEVRRYLDYRLQQVGGHARQIGVLARLLIHRYSGGVPRKINLLADAALLMAFRRQRSRVGWRHVLKATKVVNFQRSSQRRWSVVAAMLIAAFAAFGYLGTQQSFSDLLAKAASIMTEDAAQNENVANTVDTNQHEIPISTEGVNNQPTIGTDTHSEQLVTIQEPDTQLDAIPTEIVAQNVDDESQITNAVVESTENEPDMAPLQRLWSLWNLPMNSQLDWIQYCNQVTNLACYQNNQVSVDDLRRFDFPALLTLLDSQGEARTVVLASIQGQQLSYYQDSQMQTLLVSEFSQRWLGDIRLFWPRPTGFQQTMYPNEKNPLLMDWIQTGLIDKGVMTERYITGGVYNQLLVDYVKQFQSRQGLEADAVLGIRTLLAMMSSEQLVDAPKLSIGL